MATRRRKARRFPETQIRLRQILDELRLLRTEVDAIKHWIGAICGQVESTPGAGA